MKKSLLLVTLSVCLLPLWGQQNFSRIDSLIKKMLPDLRKKKVQPGLKTKGFFHIMRMIQKSGSWNEADTRYWEEKGWMQKGRPWK